MNHPAELHKSLIDSRPNTIPQEYFVLLVCGSRRSRDGNAKKGREKMREKSAAANSTLAREYHWT
jgi:hypothetical protein